jgi:hypothetical protein
MLKGLRIPTHRADAPGVFIFGSDDAWDHPRIEAEADELVEMKLAAVRREAVEAAARERGVSPDDLPADVRAEVEAGVVLTEAERADVLARHPVARFLRGESRFDLAAPDQGPRGPVASVREYLKPDAQPTEFVLRRIGHARRLEIDLERDTGRRFVRLVRAGVAAIRCGGAVLWEAKERGDSLPDEWLDALVDADGFSGQLIYLAGACKAYSAPLTDAEGKR